MKAWLRHPFRVTGRMLWLGAALAVIGLDFVWFCLIRSKGAPPLARAAWMQRSARRILRVFGVEYRTSGAVPSRGLLVCNHLSYLDIIVLASCAPAVFVAKREVLFWPVFGWFAWLGGTIFVNRKRRLQVKQFAEAIEKTLDHGALVILFPEGTSSDGRIVLPFKSSLLEPAVQPGRALAAGSIRYELDDGDVAEEICYWKDMTFLPHLINLLSKHRPRAYVRFSPSQPSRTDRKELARELQMQVAGLKAAAIAC